MSGRKVKASSAEDAAQSEEARLNDAQRVLDEVRSFISQYGFTPEQVFGYQGQVVSSNIALEASHCAPDDSAPKKTAPRKAKARTTSPKKAPAVVVEEPQVAAEEAPAAAVRATLNPASAWPFPAGSRP
jgi:hypothetical protein